MFAYHTYEVVVRHTKSDHGGDDLMHVCDTVESHALSQDTHKIEAKNLQKCVRFPTATAYTYIYIHRHTHTHTDICAQILLCSGNGGGLDRSRRHVGGMAQASPRLVHGRQDRKAIQAQFSVPGMIYVSVRVSSFSLPGLI